MAKVRLKIVKVRKGKSGRVRFGVSKLKDLEVRNAFKLALQNIFEGLQQLMEEEELSVDDEWRQIEQSSVKTFEQVLGERRQTGRSASTKTTWEIIEQRKDAKNTTNITRTRNQKRDATTSLRPLNPPEEKPNDELNIRTGCITRIEIKIAIKKLKTGKAAGCDNMPSKAIKAGGDTSADVLLGLCNRIWSEVKIPDEWRKGLLIKLTKKGDLSYCKNRCGIMLLNMAIALDWVTRTAFDRKRGIQWTFTTSLEDFDFSDDLALLSYRIQDIRNKTWALEVPDAKVGLKINATKTKLMRIGTKPGDGVSVAGERNEEVIDKFTYLGGIESKKGGTDE
ncbi:hypothetical protein ACROYT_G000178 [Oculina patagonica]